MVDTRQDGVNWKNNCQNHYLNHPSYLGWFFVFVLGIFSGYAGEYKEN